ncbi:MAG: DUF4854 domain-containing protein [Agathobacter sp.]
MGRKSNLLIIFCMILLIFACIVVGCGNKRKVLSGETNIVKSSADYVNLEAMFADEEMRALIEAGVDSLSSKDIEMSVDGKDNQLVLTAKCMKYEYSEEVAAAFEQTLDSVADSMVAQANKINSMVSDPNVSILVQYVDKNGEVLASGIFYAE